MRTESPITILAGEDLPAYRRVRNNGTSWVLADANEAHQAVTAQYILSGERGAAWSANDAGLLPVEATEAIALGGEVFGADDGKASGTGGTGRALGMAAAVVAAAGLAVPIIAGAHPVPIGLLYNAIANSGAVSNTTTETDMLSTSIPANVLKPGDVIKIYAWGKATATNSTDTLTVKLKVGSVTVNTQAANDVANDDVWAVEMILTVTDIGATGHITGMSIGTADADADADPAVGKVLASTAIDTTAAITVKQTAQWSVASASNSCRQEGLIVEVLRRAA